MIRYAIGTLLLIAAAAAMFGEFGNAPVFGVFSVLLAAAGYFNIYLALGPVDWNVLFDGLLEDRA